MNLTTVFIHQIGNEVSTRQTQPIGYKHNCAIEKSSYCFCYLLYIIRCYSAKEKNEKEVEEEDEEEN